MVRMDASAARTENIRRLVREAGGPTQFADRHGAGRWTQAQVSQWISETNPKSIGRALARALEVALALPHGALDQPPGRVMQSQSRSLRLDPVILAESIAALRQVAQARGWDYDPETHAETTCYAYELWHELPADSPRAAVIDIGARIAERLRQEMERSSGGNQQGSGAGAGADDRGQSGHSATGKARVKAGAR
ncbi:hypothetical protein MASR1M8_16110 [Thermomonas brevis]